MLIFLSSAGWLLASSALGMIATLKFHSPNILACCEYLTYGRVHPAALNALVYGFAMQAGLGVGLWLLCRLGRTPLAASALVLFGWILWNTGVTLGVLGICAGDNTGFEWLEMPRYGAAPMLIAYFALGFAALWTFNRREQGSLYISQWFFLAALFWFPWIASTAGLLLMLWPVRGTLQSVIDWWYVSNLNTIWFGFVGLAAIFYFLPKLVNRPLHSHYLGLFIFWTLLIFGSWGAAPAGAPVPAWLPAFTTFAALCVLAPVWGVAILVRGTLAGRQYNVKGGPELGFFIFASVAYVVASVLGILNSVSEIAVITNLTWFNPAQAQLFLYGFFVIAMFGAVYYIVPRVTGVEFSSGLVRAHLWLAAGGIVIYALPLLIGGVRQGLAINNPAVPFIQIVQQSLMSLRLSTLGDLLMAIGHLVFTLNLLGVFAKLGGTAVKQGLAANTRPVEVAA